MKVHVIGDSISVHYGAYLKDYLCGIMEYSHRKGVDEALLNLDKPQGANGGDSAMVVSYLKDKALSEGIDADILLLNCGLHDIKTDPSNGKKLVPIENYRENLKEIIRIVAQMKPKLIWVRTTPCNEIIHNCKCTIAYRFAADCVAYNEVADVIMKDAQIPMIDLYNFTLNLAPESELYCDHVHFHEHIRQNQAAFIAGWLSLYKDSHR